jgi:c-di-AMP phosphodiesterase-like protein
MNGSRKALYILYAIIAFIITLVVYLFTKQHYTLSISIILLCGLWIFFSIQRTAALLIQQKILDYLDQNNNETTMAEIINYIHSTTTRHNRTQITIITDYAIEKLIQKNMIVSDQGRVRKLT